MKDFVDTLAKSEKSDVPVSYAMMERYIAAKVIVEATRRMGARASREGFVQLHVDGEGAAERH